MLKGAILVMWVSGTSIYSPVADYSSMELCERAAKESVGINHRKDELTSTGRPYMMCIPLEDMKDR